MKPIKQTVYIPVNGEQEKVVCHDYPDWMDTISGVIEEEGYFFTPEQLNEYTQNVIEQTLETAAESKSLETAYTNDGLDYLEMRLSKQSITSTFEETFKKFKV